MKANQINIENFRQTPVIDQVGVNERVARLNSRSIKKTSKIAALKLALSMIDLTTLEGMDTPGKVQQLCIKAKHLIMEFLICLMLLPFVFIPHSLK